MKQHEFETILTKLNKYDKALEEIASLIEEGDCDIALCVIEAVKQDIEYFEDYIGENVES